MKHALSEKSPVPKDFTSEQHHFDASYDVQGKYLDAQKLGIYLLLREIS
jgi:hypothetical protein